MRVFALLFLLLLGSGAHAATIDGNRAVACADKGDAEKLRKIGAGDQKRWADAVQALVSADKCHMLFDGDAVRIEERDAAAGIARVALEGSKGYAGAWVDTRAVYETPVTPAASRASKTAPSDFSGSVTLGLLAAVGAVVLLAWIMQSQAAAEQAAGADVAPGSEVWEEKHLPRSLLGRFAVLAFALFNGWMFYELVKYLIHVERVRGDFRHNGFAQIAIDFVSNSETNRLLVMWAAGAAALGIAVLATRGKRQMVRRVV